MSLIRHVHDAAAGLVVLAVAATAAAGAKTRPTAGMTPRHTGVSAASRWLELQSAHFLLAGEAGERDLRDVARRLEEFREALSLLVPKARFARTPTVVLVFPHQRAYRSVAPLYQGKPIESAGFFLPAPDVNYVTIVLTQGTRAYPMAAAGGSGVRDVEGRCLEDRGRGHRRGVPAEGLRAEVAQRGPSAWSSTKSAGIPRVDDDSIGRREIGVHGRSGAAVGTPSRT